MPNTKHIYNMIELIDKEKIRGRKMSDIKVSIIMPVYKVEEYVGKAQISARDDEFGFFDFSFNTHRQHILYTQNARLANNFLPDAGKRLCKNWVKESFCRL